MHRSRFPLRALGAAASLVLIAGCTAGSQPWSGNVAPDAAGGAQSLSASGAHVLAVGRARIKGPLLYVADTSRGTVNIYLQAGNNQSPVGSIQGLPTDFGLFVDKAQHLYVTSYGSSSGPGYVAEYKRGASTPLRTLANAGQPIAVVATGRGVVYVANFNNGAKGSVLAYAPRATNPTTRYSFTGSTYPVGLALDSSGNLYVSYVSVIDSQVQGGVLEFKGRAKKPTDLGIVIGKPGGLAFDKSGNLLLVDQSIAAVDVFPPGATVPSQQIKGLHGAYDVSFDADGSTLWISEGVGGAIEAVAYPAGTVLDTISDFNGPNGIAASPAGRP